MAIRAKAQSYYDAIVSYGLLDLTIVSLLIMGAFGMLTPVLPLYLKEMGVSAEQIGFIYTTFQIVLATGEFSWGNLTDRIGMRLPLMIGMAIAALAVLGFTLTNNLALFYICNFGRALGTSALFPIGRGHIGATVPANRRATIMAVYITLQASGRTLGNFLGGLIGEQSLIAVIRVAAVFLLAASVTAIFLFKGSALKKEPVTVMAKPTADPKPAETGKNRLWNLFTVGAIITFFHASISVRQAFLSLHAVEAAGMSVAQVGFLFTLWSLIGLFFTIPLGRLADRLNWHNAMTIGLLAAALSMAGYAYANTFLLFLLASVMSALATGLFRPAANARFSETMPQRRQATAMGILGVFEDAGNMVGPAIGGLMWEGWGGPQGTFLMGTAGGFIGAVLNLVLLRKKKPDTGTV